MTKQNVQSWSRIIPSTNTSQNAVLDNIRRTTNESILNEYDSLEYSSEDIVIHCPKCDTYVKVEALRNHKTYHKALETLQWTKKEPPQNLSSLIEQRNSLISRLQDELFKNVIKQRDAPASHRALVTSVSDGSTDILSHIEELNRAFEYLKNDTDPLACFADPGSECKNRKLETEIDKHCNMSFTSGLSCVYGVGICSTQNQAYRRDMEDEFLFKDCILSGDDASAVDMSYFAVFDGYRGRTAASVASKYLHEILKDIICSLLDIQVQPTIDNDRKANRFHNSFQAEENSKDGMTLQVSDSFNEKDDKKIQVPNSADTHSGDSTTEISENSKESTVSKPIDKDRTQPSLLDGVIPNLEYDSLIQKDVVDKNPGNQLLDTEDRISDKNFNDLNHLHHERNIFVKDSHNINNKNNYQNSGIQKSKRTTPETPLKSQSDNTTIGESVLIGRVTSRTKSKETGHSASISAAFKTAYQQTDAILSYGVGETSRVRWSGCSAVTLLIESAVRHKENKSQDTRHQSRFSNDRLSQGDFTVSSSCEKSPTSSTAMLDPEEVVGRLYVANIGNVQAFLVKGNRAHRLTKQHTHKNKQEKERILQQGGFFTRSSSESLVNGVLKTTRGLGNHGDEKIRRCVLPVPSVYCTDIERQCQMLIIASAGVWDVLSGQEAASLLVQLLPMNRLPVPSRVNTSLMQLFNKRQSTVISSSPNDDKKTITNEPITYQQIGSSIQQNSQMKQQKEITKSATNGQHNLKDLNLSTKPGFSDSVELCSKSEVDGRPDIVDGSFVVKSDDSTRNTLDDFTGSNQGVLSQSEIRQHFGHVMSKYLVKAAMLAGSRQNITAMVVLLPGSGL